MPNRLMQTLRLVTTWSLLLLIMMAGCDIPESWNPPYWPTPQSQVELMLELAQVTPNDIVYDLGSGDGRIVIAAASKYGARGVGIEIESKLVKASRQKAIEAGVSNRVLFVEQDMFEADISEATVVTLYLWENVNARLKPKLMEQLKPDTRIVTNTYKIPGWTPVKQIGKLYLYSLSLKSKTEGTSSSKN